jgi:hypothetical protein
VDGEHALDRILARRHGHPITLSGKGPGNSQADTPIATGHQDNPPGHG